MNDRENTLRAIRFETPEHIPVHFHINPSCWKSYPQEALFDLMESHAVLFPGFRRPGGAYIPDFMLNTCKDKPYRDDFGCIWETTQDGITGTVTGHPLPDWMNFDNYTIPDPHQSMGLGPVDWPSVARNMTDRKRNGDLTYGELRHGHTFLQICDIRGYQNVLFDMMDEEPRLEKLIAMVEEFNLFIVETYIKMGVDIMAYAEDLGMQKGPMLSPYLFRKYIKPSYQRLMAPARRSGVIVHMHSDGDIRDLVEDIMDGGVDIINLQDLVNGIEWIANRFAGKTCVELDIDRQCVTASGTPMQIDALIREEVERIGCKAGGLMMVYGLYPGIPMMNIKALMDAMEKYAFMYS